MVSGTYSSYFVIDPRAHANLLGVHFKHPAHSDKTATLPQDAAVTVRYQVTDIERSIAFYTQHLEFQPGERAGSMFASVRRGNLRLILGGPGSSGSRPMPDGRKQEPGGWNRILIYVDELAPVVERLRKAGVKFRNDVEAGPGGKQIPGR